MNSEKMKNTMYVSQNENLAPGKIDRNNFIIFVAQVYSFLQKKN